MNRFLPDHSRFWPLGIRHQMALYYTLIFAALILAAGAIAYKQLEYSLASSLDTSLAELTQQVAHDVTYQQDAPRGIIVKDMSGNIPGSPSEQISYQNMLADLHTSALIRILDPHGNVIRTSPAFNIVHMPTASISQPLAGQTWQDTVSVNDDLDLRLYSQALTYEGHPFAIIQVGESLAQIRSILHSEAVTLLLITPVILLLCAFISTWLASLAFAPIQRVTATAHRIGASDLHQRVPVPPAHDEVHFLAVTLNEMIARLDDAFKRQRRFVADASHELRTPVAAIRSKTELALLCDRTAPEYIAIIQNINAESERLGHLVSDLLALARADEGRAHLEREPVQLALLVETVAANAELLAQERGITINVPTMQALTVLGDESRLIQIVMNLLDNALIYTRPGGHVTLYVERDSTGAHIIVRDTGEGIAPAHLPHIFERFYRVDPARTRRAGGSSGLGLAIVDWAVRAHGGSIEVESTPGQGSTFTVTLPLSTIEEMQPG